jgi:septal ring factor EnvC (AmiA/AmiB activator)
MSRCATTARALLLIAVAVFAARDSAGANKAKAAGSETKQRLESVVKELGETSRALRAVKRDERETTRLLSQLDEQRFKARDDLELLEKEVTALERQVMALRSKVAVDVDSVDQLRARVRGRLRALARAGRYSHLRVLLAADSLHDLALRRALLARVAAHDAALLVALRDGKAELRADRAELEQRFAELSASRDLAAQTLATLEETREERAEALLGLGAQRGALELRVEALRGSQKKLQRAVWSSARASTEPVGLAIHRGSLPWPLVARVERSAGGDAVSAGSGWILRAPMGAKVRSIADGRVVHAGFLRGYGMLVIVDHGHGYHTLFAHLSRNAVSAGAQVSAGDLVGYVGDSESLDGAKLYFELRRGGRPVSPGRWLSPTPTTP